MTDRKFKRVTGVRRKTLQDAMYIIACTLIFVGLIKPIVPTNISIQKAEAQSPANHPSVTPTATPAVVAVDPRVARLEAFLTEKHSPLAAHAALIVEQADKYDIGWTKIVAISGMESSFGTKLPEGSHNAWGIGGTKFMRFASWEEGIKFASKLIGQNYKYNENKGIQVKYCPDYECNPQWAATVTKFSQELLARE